MKTFSFKADCIIMAEDLDCAFIEIIKHFHNLLHNNEENDSLSSKGNVMVGQMEIKDVSIN